MTTTSEPPQWCLHKNADWVEVTALAEPHRTYMDPGCGGMRTEYFQRCPRCGDEIPPDDDVTGEGPVYWTESWQAYCSMECVIWTHRQWLKAQRLSGDLSAQEVLQAIGDRSGPDDCETPTRRRL